MNVLFVFTCIMLKGVVSQDIYNQAFTKYPECLLPENPGFCTPVIRYGVQPPANALRLVATCEPYEYYGSGGNPGFNSFAECIYACGEGPLVTSLQARN